jgi:hypothetical protein
MPQYSLRTATSRGPAPTPLGPDDSDLDIPVQLIALRPGNGQVHPSIFSDPGGCTRPQSLRPHHLSPDRVV